MMGLAYDCLLNPQRAIRMTFQNEILKPLIQPPSTARTGALLIYSGSFSMTMAAFLTRLKSNNLVRFRGMIQDMLGNELYVGMYKDGETWRTNKFGEFFQLPMAIGSSPDMRAWEQRLLYCIPILRQNSWIEYSSKPLPNPSSESSSPQREKCHREVDTTMDDIDMQVLVHRIAIHQHLIKLLDFVLIQQRENGIASNSSNLGDTPTANVGSATSVLPYFDRTSLSCLLKIYDSPESDLNLNDFFEFIGVLTFDTEFSVDKNVDNDFMGYLGYDDTQTQMPPTKYILLFFQVHVRVDSTAVGKLSLNLTCFNKETLSVYGHRLNLALKNLLPFTQCLPLTVDYRNKIPLAPQKNYQTNRSAASGLLQLVEGSHLTIDETQSQEERLNPIGFENARVLQRQKVIMD
uniref:Mini-chromosome maintenance complex-binding protein n=1 Tax=Solanum lycopersicum TaxID=4081 RepID=A0A3Q7HN21_SOLLC